MKKILLVCLIFALAVSLSAPVDVRSEPAAQPSPLDQLAANTQSILVGDVVHVTGPYSGWTEITTVAYGPNENAACPQGRLFFGSASNIIATTLEGALISFASGAPNPWSAPISESPKGPNFIYDNHLVKLKTGEMVHTVIASTYLDNISPHPWWWDQYTTYPFNGDTTPGLRGIIYTFRSADCGETWVRAGDLDSAKVSVTAPALKPISGAAAAQVPDSDGLCATIRLRRDNANVTTSHFGGWDGHYLLADPYSGYLFMAMSCTYGSPTGQENAEGNLAVMFVSKDKGDSWQLIMTEATSSPNLWTWRTPIASNSDGVIAYVIWDWTNSKVKMVTFDPNDSWVSLAGASDVASFNNYPLATAIDTEKSGMARFSTLVGNNLNPASFYLAVPSIQNGGEMTTDLYNTDGSSVRKIGDTLNSLQSYSNSAMFHGGLVEPLPNSTLSVYYWTDVIPTSPNLYGERFQVLSHGEALLSTPGQLSVVNGGEPSPWLNHNQFWGDYFNGAAYRDQNGNPVFVCVWSEDGALTFNTVTLAPPVKRPWIADWNWDGFVAQANELYSTGLGMADLSVSVHNDGRLGVNAVWQAAAQPHPWVAGWADVSGADAAYRGQGYGMLSLSGMVLPGDQARYNAIWSKSSHASTWIAGWGQEGLSNTDTQQRAMGNQIVELTAVVFSGDEVRYNAIWAPDPQGHAWVAGWGDSEFFNMNTAMVEQGYRLIDISIFKLSGDRIRYNGIWALPTKPVIWAGSHAAQDFYAQETRMRSSHNPYLISNLHSVVLSGEQLMLSGLWEMFYTVDLPLIRR